MWIILGIIVVLVIWAIAVYNGLIRLKNRVDEAWSDIDVQLKRRYDLIPNLVNTVKGYAAHEKEVFEKVTEARTRAMGAQSAADKAQAENMLSADSEKSFRGGRSLSRSQSQPELSGTSAGTHRHGRQNPGIAPVLQRQCARLQHENSSLPQQYLCRYAGIHFPGVL